MLGREEGLLYGNYNNKGDYFVEWLYCFIHIMFTEECKKKCYQVNKYHILKIAFNCNIENALVKLNLTLSNNFSLVKYLNIDLSYFCGLIFCHS